jgi:hypothetical protein
MEPLIVVLVPGVLGGIVLAVLILRLRFGARSPAPDARLEPPSPSLINMAHIPVQGLGGLGMVAMAIVVAIFVPRIRLSMIAAVLLGVALAAVLIAARRRTGPLSSSGRSPGAHAMLRIDEGRRGTPSPRPPARQRVRLDVIAP